MSSTNLPTRTRILDAAWKLLESSASKARMSDIAKAAGVSRQAVYLHFPNRAELLIATTKHIDEAKDIDARLAPSRNAPSGHDRLERFIEAWGNYIPEIYGVASALMAMQDNDDEARQAWGNRMQAVREGCEAAVDALIADARLANDLNRQTATDILWMLLSVSNWAHLRRTCGWTQQTYITQMKAIARRTLVSVQAA